MSKGLLLLFLFLIVNPLEYPAFASDEQTAKEIADACTASDERCDQLIESRCRRSTAACLAIADALRPFDTERARSAYDEACASGDAAGCYNFGIMLYKGDGGQVDKTGARAAFDKACEGGYAAGCYNFGSMLYTGDGGQVDKTGARAAYGKACEGGYAAGCYNFGNMLSNGHGGQVDKAGARAAYGKACEGGYAEGCINLGLMLANGEGGEVDRARARELYEQACADGNAVACANFAEMRRETLAENCPANPVTRNLGYTFLPVRADTVVAEHGIVVDEWEGDDYKPIARITINPGLSGTVGDLSFQQPYFSKGPRLYYGGSREVTYHLEVGSWENASSDVPSDQSDEFVSNLNTDEVVSLKVNLNDELVYTSKFDSKLILACRAKAIRVYTNE